MKNRLEILINSAKALLSLARYCAQEGRLEESRELYLKAVKQGMLIRRLKEQQAGLDEIEIPSLLQQMYSSDTVSQNN